MRFAGIDIGGERHAVAIVNDNGALLVRSTLFGEEAVGYQRLRVRTTASLVESSNAGAPGGVCFAI
jgi:predicted NBD/HSP70 family sugar kinase